LFRKSLEKFINALEKKVAICKSLCYTTKMTVSVN